MKQTTKVFISLALALATTGLSAEKVIYVHGMDLTTTSDHGCQDMTSCSKWAGDRAAPAGQDAVYVGYNASQDAFAGTADSGSVRLLQILNKYCRKDQGQSCRIVGESMGAYTTAGTIAMYNTNGIYDINYATLIVSAEGGSEIANLGDGAIDVLKMIGIGFILEGAWGRVADSLKTSVARSRWDHNRNNGAMIYQVPANKSNFLIDPLLPGEDDNLVAFHSSCGYRTTGGFNQCMGQKIRSCSWCFWQRKKLVSPWEGRQMHPAVSIEGVNDDHGIDNIADYFGL